MLDEYGFTWHCDCIGHFSPLPCLLRLRQIEHKNASLNEEFVVDEQFQSILPGFREKDGTAHESQLHYRTRVCKFR